MSGFKNDFSKEVWELTYKNYNDVDIKDNWKRISSDLSSDEDADIKDEIEHKFYNLVSDFKFVPAGRIYSNAGTEWGGTTYINCFVSDRNKYDIDSIEGIFSVLRDQALTLKSEGGWGCNFSFIRPRGSFIHGIGVESPGPVKFMTLFNTSSDVITSGSGTKAKNKKAKKKIRKGAMMGILDVWHPSVIEFIKSKQNSGMLDKFNISVGVYNDFMDKIVEIEKLKKNGEDIPKELDEWNLEFPDTTFHAYKDEWVGDIHDWKDRGYPVVVYETVSAYELWELIMKSTYNRNDPGVLFLDIANKTHCWNYGDKKISRILSTNPCFSGDTKIAVADGRNYVTIKELAKEGKDVPVYSLNTSTGETEIKWGRNPRITGYNQTLLRVKLDNDTHLDVTPNHKFITKDGRTVEAKDLVKGDSLPRFLKEQDEIKENGKKLYWRVKTNQCIKLNKRTFEHRLISKFFEPDKWEYMRIEGKCGGWADGGLVVHHKDYNGLNNDPSNLEIMTWREHNKFHAEHDFWGEKNPMFGKSHTDETKELIGNKTKERNKNETYFNDWKNSIKNSMNNSEIRNKISKSKHNFEVERRLKLAKDTGLNAYYDEVEKEIFVHKICEASGKPFITAWNRREVCYASGEAMNDPKIQRKATDSKNVGLWEKSKQNLHRQVMVYKDLSEELGRLPQKKEWERECKENGVSVRFQKVTENPHILSGFRELQTVSDSYNHRVSSVEELVGEHTVYNITVEDNHTVAICGEKFMQRNGIKSSLSGIYTFQCGEQTLPSGGCCNLGSFNLTQYVKDDLSGFDLDKLKDDVRTAVRLLDNVNTRSSAPLDAYKTNMADRRRIGLGIMGWGSALFLLKTRFGSKKSEKIKEELLKAFTYTAIDASVDLAIEKGAFVGCDKEKHADHSYFKQIGLPKDTVEKIRKHGIRNSALFSIQPTGNTGILANNVSGGGEPIFMPEYIRTSIVPICPDHIKDKCPKYWEGEFKETEMFKMTKEGTDDVLVGVDEFGVTYKIDKNRGLTKDTLCEDYAVSVLKDREEWDKDAEWAVTTTKLDASEHILDMRGWAKYIDAAMSKTVNLPEDYPYDKFKDIYLDCYKTGVIKGFTTYRAGTMTSVMKGVDDKPQDESNDGMLKSAKKRPKELDAEIHLATAKGEQYIVAVGLLDDQPYEVFGGKANGFGIKQTCRGKLIKHKKGQYGLEIGDLEVDDFSKHFTPQEQTIFRLASTNLRHGVPIEFTVEQMRKSTDDMFSLPSAVARVLKKYIKDGQKVSGQECPECGCKELIYQEGCTRCSECLWTACG